MAPRVLPTDNGVRKVLLGETSFLLLDILGDNRFNQRLAGHVDEYRAGYQGVRDRG